MHQTYQYQSFPFTPPPELNSDAVVRHPLIVVGCGPVGLAAAIDARRAELEAEAAAADAKAAALASARAKLAALGLTDDEIAALLGA